ncbi:BLUF domain-containing protein [Variovorax sp. J22G73]|uniref:BLUF domain-containing protein n=1 Tax=unclassified Variovorax TaxID=663243 RepID=UPI00257894D1|nr:MULTISPECIES: BLUF domain-containing protein [unclassified Variovorax]MDM0010589.1 BLUF domain-containing protein [Variovorax sp. J22R203]MDM0103082.1 BLUF domain-containing protein [Variovorax sp. J22G73]
MLSRLIYRSVSKNPSGEDVANILSASRRNNREIGITGALCHLRGTYMQYLEGEEAAIECVMAAILQDQRHCNLSILEFRFIAARAFPQWSMAMLEWSRDIEVTLGPLADMGLHGITCTSAAPVFRALTALKAWRAL